MKHFLVAAGLALLAAPAAADTFSFYCFSQGDLGYEIIIDNEMMDHARFNISGGYDFPDNERHQVLYGAHVEEGLVFRNTDYVFQTADLINGMLYFPQFPDERVECDPALRAAAAPVAPVAPQGGADLWRGGLSLGGKLRAGPGVTYPQTGSLREYTPLTIVRGSGVVWDGYEWFEVQVGTVTAYQWGGIMCAQGGLPGVYGTC